MKNSDKTTSGQILSRWVFAVSLALSTSLAVANEVIEEIEFEGDKLTITETEDYEKVIALGERELGRAHFAGFDRITDIQGVPVALFYLGDGGNACGPSTLIIWRDDDGRIQTLNHKEGCITPAPALSDNRILFVPFLNPGDEATVKSWSPYDGLLTLGMMRFTPEVGTGWETLKNSPPSHPLDFFQNAVIYKLAKETLGAELSGYVQGLRVASEPQKLQSGMIMASGCIPHACGSGDSFIGIDPANQALFMAQQKNEDFAYWPPLADWSDAAKEAFGIFKASR